MFKRSRRTTVCTVEQLEGRVVLSAIAARADVIGISSKTLNLYGYTKFPTKPGETLELSVVQHRLRLPSEIVGRTVHVVVQPTSRPRDSGSFSAEIHVADDADRFYPDGSLELDAGLVSGRRIVERYFSEIAVTRD
jgi:hypothetical protein